jgi:hypothetical protein
VAQFSLTVSKSTGVGRANESTRHIWKLFRWWFPSRHRLSFRWPFLSQQGLRALMNPHLTFGRFLGDYFWVGNDPIFVDYLWVNRGCGRWRIHTSPSESVSLMISETVVAQFSLTFSKSTGVGRVDESTHHLWKLFSLTFSESTGAASTSKSTRHLWNRFRSRFRRRQWLSFH